MNVIVESITLEGGMQNAKGVVLFSLGPNLTPTRMAFTGTLTVMPGPSPQPTIQAPTPPKPEPRVKRPQPQTKKAPTAEAGMKWTDSILQSLGENSLTSSELFEHCMRIRGVQIRTVGEKKVQMVRMQAAMTECKRRGLILRTVENQIDKWKANAASNNNLQSWPDAICQSLSESSLLSHNKLFEAAIKLRLGRVVTEKAERDQLSGQFRPRLSQLRSAGRVIEIEQGGTSMYRLATEAEQEAEGQD